MRVVADRTILRHWWMLVRKRSLFVSVALITHHVHGRLFEIVLRLTMRVVAIGANHLAFLDRMVRRHRGLGIDLRMALVAGLRFVHRHRHSWFSLDVRMMNINLWLDVGIRMRIVAINTCNTIERM